MIPCILLTMVFTLVLYTPVILVSNGITPIVANRFVQSQQWQYFLGQITLHFRETIHDFLRDIPTILLFPCIILVIIGIYSSARNRDWLTLLILPSILVGSTVIFFLQHKIPHARTWIYVIPFILLVADTGFTVCLENMSLRLKTYSKTITFILSLILAVQLVSTDAIAYYPDTGRFAEAPLVAKYLKSISTSQDFVHVNIPASWPTYYNLWYYGVEYQKKSHVMKLEGSFISSISVITLSTI